jgi:hypothetical protein
MKKLIILLMAGLMIMPACQNSKQTKLLSELCSLQRKASESKKLPSLNFSSKWFPFSVGVPLEFLWYLVKLPVPYVIDFFS